jgi:hypothetical protein
METELFIKVKQLLQGHKLIMSDEKQLQAQIMSILGAAPGFPFFVREYTLTGAGIIDFLITGGVGIEVKIKGSPMAIHRQLKRYAKHSEVNEIILVTSKTMTLPEYIEGKPANFIQLSKSWL